MKLKNYKLLASVRPIVLALLLSVLYRTASSQITYTFNYTGSVQPISLSAGLYSIECWGANGGWGGTTTALTGTGGIGGYCSGVYAVTTPTTLYVYVGGVGQSTNTTGAAVVSAAGGWNGGGGGRNGTSNSYYRGGGGGGSDVRTTQNNIYTDRVIVAGGGGGAGGSSGTPLTWVGSGGNGGGQSGQDGVLAGSQTNHNGKAGTQTTGGAGGINGTNIGVAGTVGIGGDGGGTSNAFPAGGGGGGWFGGGGGAVQGGGGGGGSSYTGGVTSGTTIMYGQPGYVPNPDVTGNGLVLIKELCSISLVVSGLNSNSGLCPGNSVTITTNAVSNYSWTTGSTSSSIVATPSVNTVYGLTATSPSNCITSAQVTINVSTPPVISVTNNNPVVCLGGQAILSVTGSDTYSWSNNSTAPNVTVVPTQNTIYSVTGTSTLTNCSTTETLSVDVFTPNVTVSGNNSICVGGTATLSANAAGATSYYWSTGLPIQSILVSPANHAIYVVTAQVSTLNISCTAVNSIQVTVNPNPNIIVVASRTAICVNETAVLSAGAATSYSWSWGTQTATSASIAITPSVSTNIIVNVTGTNANGCSSSDWVGIVVNNCTGLEELSLSEHLLVYPNPSQAEFKISNSTAAELRLINEMGQEIRKISLNEDNEFQETVVGLSDGIYFITGQSGTNSFNKKIVIAK